MMLKLTDNQLGKPVYVSLSHIVSMQPGDSGTLIKLTTGAVHVRQSPDQILTLARGTS